MNGNSRTKRSADLITCLENFIAPEQLEGRKGMKENAAYACTNCGAEGKVTKRLEIKRVPPLLCVQFKVKLFLSFAMTPKHANGESAFDETRKTQRR